MLNTARSNFPTDADMSYHVQSTLNRGEKNTDMAFIAANKFKVQRGVTLRYNGKIMRHKSGES